MVGVAIDTANQYTPHTFHLVHINPIITGYMSVVMVTAQHVQLHDTIPDVIKLLAQLVWLQADIFKPIELHQVSCHSATTG